MQILGWFLIAAAVLVGYLYWDKCRELKIARGEIEPDLPSGSLFFFNLDREDLLKEAEEMIRLLAEEGLQLLHHEEHLWGFEQRYTYNHKGHVASWVNYIIDCRCEHPTFAARAACFDNSLTVAQTINEIHNLPDGVSVYARGEENIEDGED